MHTARSMRPVLILNETASVPLYGVCCVCVCVCVSVCAYVRVNKAGRGLQRGHLRPISVPRSQTCHIIKWFFKSSHDNSDSDSCITIIGWRLAGAWLLRVLFMS